LFYMLNCCSKFIERLRISSDWRVDNPSTDAI
jgi:hypothetical protein